MNDRAVALLEQYDCEVLRTRKGRGSILCDTDKGTLAFLEYRGNEKRLAVQNALLEQVNSWGWVGTERILPSREGALWVKDGDGTAYILKTFCEGRECNIRDREECLEAVRLLAKLHCCLERNAARLEENARKTAASGEKWILLQKEATEDFEEKELGQKTEKSSEAGPVKNEEQGSKVDSERNLEQNPQKQIRKTSKEEEELLSRHTDWLEECRRHNREFRKIRRYLKKKGQKNSFERCLFVELDRFIEQAEEVTCRWEEYLKTNPIPSENSLWCHGDYQYHNIVKGEDGWHIVNFEHCCQDNPVKDLYLILRKLLEKCSWQQHTGRELMSAYEAIRPLSEYSKMELKLRLSYPEKFWKIANFYYGSNKAFIPVKNMEKLQKLLEQEEGKQRFLLQIFP